MMYYMVATMKGSTLACALGDVEMEYRLNKRALGFRECRLISFVLCSRDLHIAKNISKRDCAFPSGLISCRMTGLFALPGVKQSCTIGIAYQITLKYTIMLFEAK